MMIEEAVEALSSTYKSLEAVAIGLPVDAQEVAEALADATPDTVEFVCLSVLSKLNPYVAPAVEE